MSLLLWAATYLLQNLSSALPIQAATGRREQGPTNGNERTVPDIVWSCLTTIFACTWISVHPNMPGPGESWVRTARKRLRVMFLSLIAPEVVMLWAMRQWVGARKVEKKYRSEYCLRPHLVSLLTMTRLARVWLDQNPWVLHPDGGIRAVRRGRTKRDFIP
jgi:hypothetical protein